jgi:hypothetical protein
MAQALASNKPIRVTGASVTAPGLEFSDMQSSVRDTVVDMATWGHIPPNSEAG